jgi:hypothetical protein
MNGSVSKNFIQKILILIFCLSILSCYSNKDFRSQKLNTDISIFNTLTVDAKFFNYELKPIKDFFYTCRTYGASGTILDYKTEKIYQVVPPKSEIIVKNINMGFINPQTTKIVCSPSLY